MKKKKKKINATDILSTKGIIQIVEFKMFPRISWNKKITYLRGSQPKGLKEGKDGKKAGIAFDVTSNWLVKKQDSLTDSFSA